MGPIVWSETSVTNYQGTLHNIPEERGSHLHSIKSMKSRNVKFVLIVTIVYNEDKSKRYKSTAMLRLKSPQFQTEMLNIQ
jgi:hypothetical protein